MSRLCIWQKLGKVQPNMDDGGARKVGGSVLGTAINRNTAVGSIHYTKQ